MDKNDIARVCHEANRAYCVALNDHTQQPWDQAAQWQRDSAVKGVEFALAHPHADPSAQHVAWMDDKLAQGWMYGPVKDAELKQHPSLLPYYDLPEHERAKDALFRAIVGALDLRAA